MDRKERILKILKRAGAVLIFLLPCALYYLSVKHRAGDALLYTAPYQWWVAALSLAAGIFSYAVLCRSKPVTDAPKEESEESLYEDLQPEGEQVSQSPDDREPLEEYPELFRQEKKADETLREFDMAAQIASAIGEQKTEVYRGAHTSTVTLAENEDGEVSEDGGDGEVGEWENYLKKTNAENADFPAELAELYENIPSSLPEGYTVTAEDTYEERGFSEKYTVKRISLGESAASKVMCTAIAVLLSAGFAFGASFALTSEGSDGFSVGKKEYVWSDAETVTVSQKLFGSLSVEVETSDGKKTELFPSTLFRGENFSSEYENVYEYMARAVRKMTEAGASLTVNGREEIETFYKDAEDGSWKYIWEIIGERDKDND
ncbi:MAG: hypothetical protein PUC29_08285 [Clostridia bacterium]|nr:hypothetical protein [Clostridia bacterium]